MPTADRTDPERNARDTLALIALALAVLIVVLGAIALIADNLYGWDDSLDHLTLTLLGVAAAIAGLNHFRRDRRDPVTPYGRTDASLDDPPAGGPITTDPGGTTIAGRHPRGV
jgi:hypothetical protein